MSVATLLPRATPGPPAEHGGMRRLLLGVTLASLSACSLDPNGAANVGGGGPGAGGATSTGGTSSGSASTTSGGPTSGSSGGGNSTSSAGGGGEGGAGTSSSSVQASSSSDASSSSTGGGGPLGSCAEAPDDGVYDLRVHVDVAPIDELVEVRTLCAELDPGSGVRWALLHNSVADPGATAFFQIAGADVFTPKGRPALDALFHAGALYRAIRATAHPAVAVRDTLCVETPAARCVDVVASMLGTAGLDTIPPTLNFVSSAHVSPSPAGVQSAFDRHLSSFSVWEGPGGPCSTAYDGVSQHYGGCLAWSLGSGPPGVTGGPRGYGAFLVASGLDPAADPAGFGALSRASRWVRW